MGFKLTTLKVIGTDFTGSCKSYYYTINATMTHGLGVKHYLVNVLKKVHDHFICETIDRQSEMKLLSKHFLSLESTDGGTRV